MPDDLSELEDEVMARLARIDLTNSGTGTYVWDLTDDPQVDITNRDTTTLHFTLPDDWDDDWDEDGQTPEPTYEEPLLTGHPYRGTLVVLRAAPTLSDRIRASWDGVLFWLRGLVY